MRDSAMEKNEHQSERQLVSRDWQGKLQMRGSCKDEGLQHH